LTPSAAWSQSRRPPPPRPPAAGLAVVDHVLLVKALLADPAAPNLETAATIARRAGAPPPAARTGEQGSLHRQCGSDLPRAELPGAGAPRHRRPRKQLAVVIRSTRRLRRAHHYRRLRFASCGRGDACLPSASLDGCSVGDSLRDDLISP
jgi:hypothetical protein